MVRLDHAANPFDKLDIYSVQAAQNALAIFAPEMPSHRKIQVLCSRWTNRKCSLVQLFKFSPFPSGESSMAAMY